MSRDRTRTPSSTSVAGFDQDVTPPTLVGNMSDRWDDPSEGPPEDLDPAGGVRPVKGTKVRAMARRLWSTSFAHEHNEELKCYTLSGLLESASDITAARHSPSSYLRQNRSSEIARARREDIGLSLLMRWCAESTHERNHGNIPFSVASRSVQHLGHKSSIRSWTETAGVLAKSTATLLVNVMVAVRLPCSFKQSLRVYV